MKKIISIVTVMIVATVIVCSSFLMKNEAYAVTVSDITDAVSKARVSEYEIDRLIAEAKIVELYGKDAVNRPEYIEISNMKSQKHDFMYYIDKLKSRLIQDQGLHISDKTKPSYCLNDLNKFIGEYNKNISDLQTSIDSLYSDSARQYDYDSIEDYSLFTYDEPSLVYNSMYKNIDDYGKKIDIYRGMISSTLKTLVFETENMAIDTVNQKATIEHFYNYVRPYENIVKREINKDVYDNWVNDTFLCMSSIEEFLEMKVPGISNEPVTEPLDPSQLESSGNISVGMNVLPTVSLSMNNNTLVFDGVNPLRYNETKVINVTTKSNTSYNIQAKGKAKLSNGVDSINLDLMSVNGVNIDDLNYSIVYDNQPATAGKSYDIPVVVGSSKWNVKPGTYNTNIDIKIVQK